MPFTSYSKKEKTITKGLVSSLIISIKLYTFRLILLYFFTIK